MSYQKNTIFLNVKIHPTRNLHVFGNYDPLLPQKDWFKYTNPLIFRNYYKLLEIFNSTSYIEDYVKCGSISMNHFTINGVIESDADFFLLLHDKTQPIYYRNNHHMIYFNREYLKIGYTLYKTSRPSTLTYPCVDYRREKYFKYKRSLYRTMQVKISLKGKNVLSVRHPKKDVLLK